MTIVAWAVLRFLVSGPGRWKSRGGERTDGRLVVFGVVFKLCVEIGDGITKDSERVMRLLLARKVEDECNDGHSNVVVNFVQAGSGTTAARERILTREVAIAGCTLKSYRR